MRLWLYVIKVFARNICDYYYVCVTKILIYMWNPDQLLHFRAKVNITICATSNTNSLDEPSKMALADPDFILIFSPG